MIICPYCFSILAEGFVFKRCINDKCFVNEVQLTFDNKDYLLPLFVNNNKYIAISFSHINLVEIWLNSHLMFCIDFVVPNLSDLRETISLIEKQIVRILKIKAFI